MDHDTQVQLIREVHRLVDDKSTDMADDEYRVPLERYTDPLRYEVELERLFRQAPLAVGHVSEVREVGSFKTITIADVPILICRGKDGSLHAYRNVCRHRGTTVVEEERGTSKSFQCPYHAWTYNLDGALVSIPDSYGFPCVAEDKENYGLTKLWCGEAGGFIFVRPDGGEPDFSIEQWAQAIANDFDVIGLADYEVFAPSQRDWALNWKLPLDIFLENYHTKFTHRETIFPVFIQNLGKFDYFQPHSRCVLPKRSIVELRSRPEDEWDLIANSTILYTLFPNTMIAVLPEHVAIWHVYPSGIGSSTADFYTLISPRASHPRARAEWEKSLVVVGRVEDEDTGRALSIQNTLRSGANEHFVFGRFEKALAWHHEAIEQSLAHGVGSLIGATDAMANT